MLRRYLRLRSLKNPALRALLIGDGLVLTAAAMLTPIYAVFVAGVGGDVFDAGITAGALALGAGIASLIAGKYTDALRNKKMMIVYGYIVIGLGFLLYTSVHTIVYLAAVQLVIGLVRPLYEPAFDALYSVHLDKSREAEEWGTWDALSYFAAAIGAFVGGWVAKTYSFSTLFIAMALMCFVSALYILRVPKRVL